MGQLWLGNLEYPQQGCREACEARTRGGLQPRPFWELAVSPGMGCSYCYGSLLGCFRHAQRVTGARLVRCRREEGSALSDPEGRIRSAEEAVSPCVPEVGTEEGRAAAAAVVQGASWAEPCSRLTDDLALKHIHWNGSLGCSTGQAVDEDSRPLGRQASS